MFDIGWGEMVIIGVVALVVIGPKELPTVLRTVGQWAAKARRMASEFQGQFQEAMREAEVADLKKQFEDATKKATEAVTFDPLDTTRKEIESAFDDKPAETPAAAPSAETASFTPTGTSEDDTAASSEPPPTSEAVTLPPPEEPVVLPLVSDAAPSTGPDHASTEVKNDGKGNAA